MKSTVPGLERGIHILEILADGHERSLEELVRVSGYPKTSVLRILDTLSGLSLVQRDPVTKFYRGLKKLLPLGEGSQTFDQVIADKLTELARKHGQTMEWYTLEEDGIMAMTQRSEPEHANIRVLARIGYKRNWISELESVTAISWAFLRPGQSLPAFYDYNDQGLKRDISSEEASQRIEQALQDRQSVDSNYNPNGIRRIASAVLHRNRLIGILVMATCFTPQAEQMLPERVK